LNKTLHLFLNKIDNIQNKKIVVGFSGGADSTALIDLLAIKKDFFNFELEAVFFSHGLSPIAVDEHLMEKFCSDFCINKKIKLTIIDLELEKIPRQGWESSGRKARQEYYRSVNPDLIFLGHHKDDQNETTLTQLFRGGGKGTIGMKKFDGLYCRPFLEHHKIEIYDYLKEKNIGWVEDPTNKDIDFTRNFWRNVGIPTIEQHYPKYSQILDKFRSKQEELYELAYDMALTDGLENFIKKEPINISSLSGTRLKNLITHIFSSLGKSMEDAFYDQQVSHYFANKKIDINHKNICISIKNNLLINKIPEPEVIINKKNKP
jgi:tRNA(Ile)-lysidine synthase